jgi:glycosyltransferase involved in cell wall biosynthesis
VRVLHFHDAPRIHGGATAYLKQLLPQMVLRGHENLVYGLDEAAEGLPDTIASTHFQYQRPTSALRRRLDFHYFHAPLAEHLEKWLVAQSPDVVHIQNCAAFRSTVFPTIYKLGLPILMTVHDFTLIDPNPFGLDRSGITGGLRTLLDRRSLKADRKLVFACTKLFLCPTLALRDGIGFPSERSRLQRLPIQPAELLPLPTDHLRIFFAGTLFRSKGVDLLIEALSTSSHAALQQATLQIAGSGDCEVELRQQVARAGLTARVKFLGFCNEEQMAAAYAASNLQVLPSRVPENSPLTVLEAGARGRPSLASHAGGVPELLPPNRGWTFVSEDVASLRRQLENLAGDLATLASHGAAMREWVRTEFAPQRHWDDVDFCYHELCP